MSLHSCFATLTCRWRWIKSAASRPRPLISSRLLSLVALLFSIDAFSSSLRSHRLARWAATCIAPGANPGEGSDEDFAPVKNRDHSFVQ